jgi:ABC-type transport system involved in cytochrome bd biosynthesis fused ATPase/permease subunit
MSEIIFLTIFLLVQLFAIFIAFTFSKVIAGLLTLVCLPFIVVYLGVILDRGNNNENR